MPPWSVEHERAQDMLVLSNIAMELEASAPQRHNASQILLVASPSSPSCPSSTASTSSPPLPPLSVALFPRHRCFPDHSPFFLSSLVSSSSFCPSLFFCLSRPPLLFLFLLVRSMTNLSSQKLLEDGKGEAIGASSSLAHALNQMLCDKSGMKAHKVSSELALRLLIKICVWSKAKICEEELLVGRCGRCSFLHPRAGQHARGQGRTVPTLQRCDSCRHGMPRALPPPRLQQALARDRSILQARPPAVTSCCLVLLSCLAVLPCCLVLLSSPPSQSFRSSPHTHTLLPPPSSFLSTSSP